MPPTIRHRNRQVYIDLAPLVGAALESTEITADAAAASGSITVKDIDGFAVDKILLIGELGVEGSEVIKTHGSTAPSGTTVTLASNTEFAHAAGTKVYIIEFDQIEISHADTLTGSKSTLATVSVQADERFQVYTDTTETTGYYFARYKESIGSTFGPYADGVPYGGYAATSVAYAINYALTRNGMRNGFDDEIDLQFCIDEINDFLRKWQGRQKRWPEHFKENTDIGNIDAGTPMVTVPTDAYDQESNQSILAVRVGSGANLDWYDPVEFEEHLKPGEIRTTVDTEASASDTTITLSDGRDFADAGSLTFFVSGTKYSITYTSVNRTTGVFSGVPASGTGAITVTVPAGTYIYQGTEFGKPSAYTTRGGNIELHPVPNASYHNLNIYADYWKVATTVDSEGDDLDVTRYDAAKYYLAWKVRCQKKNDGILDYGDGFYKEFESRMVDAIRNKPKVMTHKSRPFRRWGVTD